MSDSFRFRRLATGNPLTNAVAVVAGALAVLIAIVLGFFALLLVAMLLLALAAVFGVRLWWFRRKLHGSRGEGHSQARDGDASDRVIEGEFTVVSTRNRRTHGK